MGSDGATVGSHVEMCEFPCEKQEVTEGFFSFFLPGGEETMLAKSLQGQREIKMVE